MTNFPAPIADLQRTCHVFSRFPERYLVELETEGAVRTYKLDVGEGLTFRTQEDKHEALVLLRGKIQLRRDGVIVASLSDEDLSCRMIPLEGRSTEVLASGPATLCRIAKDQLDYLISWSVMLDELPADDATVRSRLTQLRYPAIFMNLPFTNVVKAFQRMTTRHVKAGEEIIKQGEPGDLFYIIESGRAEIWQQGPYDDEQKLVGVRVPGNHVGDEALVTGGSRNATVRIMEDSTLLVLAKEDFRELISQPMVNEVEIPVAKALAEQGYRFLDVRYEEEWEDGHIPGATLLPLTDIRERMDELDRSGKFIAYCLSGKRSAVAAMILRANGFETVCMKDGLRKWPDQTVTD
jgi:rhodanese-related sulfurtransferase/signal-transduction protein with cAMP-binding, CBS, and nucleotidyltransferase domain